VLQIFISSSAVFIKNFDTSLKIISGYPQILKYSMMMMMMMMMMMITIIIHIYLLIYLSANSACPTTNLKVGTSTNTQSNTVMKRARPRLKYQRNKPVL